MEILFNQEQENFQKLIGNIRSSPCSIYPFIGSGVSRCGFNNKKHLPSWSELLERVEGFFLENHNPPMDIVDNLKQKKKDKISYLEYMKNEMGSRSFVNAINSILSIEDMTIPPMVEVLSDLPWHFLITTNLDQFFENAYTKKNILHNVLTWRSAMGALNAAEIPKKNCVTLFKIHGTISDPESWILAKEEYEKISRQEGYLQVLSQLLLRNFLFIGYSLSDEYIIDTIKDISSRFGFAQNVYYLLIDKSSLQNKQKLGYLKSMNVRPIFYAIENSFRDDPYLGHRGAFECIMIIRRFVKDHNTGLFLGNLDSLDIDFVGRDLEKKRILKEISKPGSHGVQIFAYGGEGKTQLVLSFLNDYSLNLSNLGFFGIFCYTLYTGTPESLIQSLYEYLFEDTGLRNTTDMVEHIKLKIKDKKYLLFIDGLEIVQTKDGEIKNIMIDSILNAIYNSPSVLILTSRIRVLRRRLGEIKLMPLSDIDALSLARLHNIDINNKVLIEKIFTKTQKHALSLKITLEMIERDGVLAIDAMNSILDVSIYDKEDSNLNKTERVLRQYESLLDKNEIAFMICFSAFQKPTNTSMVIDVFSRDIYKFSVNSDLNRQNIRGIIDGLIRLRLLTKVSDILISCHMTIFEYFSKKYNGNMQPLHYQIYRYYMDFLLTDESPVSFEESKPFIDASYHAAKAGDITAFEYIFINILNQGDYNFMGTSLGAWFEYYELLKLAYPNEDIGIDPIFKPEYIMSETGRALKRIGSLQKSFDLYFRCIQLCINKKEEKTSRYANNLLTLIISMGNLNVSNQCIKLNSVTIGMSKDELFIKWQKEAALYTYMHVAGLVGDKDAILSYFKVVQSIWSKSEDRREKRYNFERVFAGYHLFYAGLDIDACLKIQEEYENELKVLRSYSCLARLYIVNSLIYIRDSIKTLNSEAIDLSNIMLKNAQDQIIKASIPEIDVEILIALIKQEIAKYVINGACDKVFVSDSKEKMHGIISGYNLNIYIAEMHLVNAWCAYLNEDIRGAEFLLNESYQACNKTFVFSIINDKYSLFNVLSEEIGFEKNRTDETFRLLHVEELSFDFNEDRCTRYLKHINARKIM